MSMTYSDILCGDMVDDIFDLINSGDERSYDQIEREMLCKIIDDQYEELHNLGLK